MEQSLRVDCPCCGAKLVVARDTGDVVTFEAPKAAPKSFDEAVGEMRSGHARREDAFAKAFDRTRRLEQVLDKKFEEARKKAEDDPAPPRNPFEGE
jgi:hypothetical protein